MFVVIAVKRRKHTGPRCRFAGADGARIFAHAPGVILARGRRNAPAGIRLADFAFPAARVGWHVHAPVVRTPIIGALKRVGTGGRIADRTLAFSFTSDRPFSLAFPLTLTLSLTSDWSFTLSFSLTGERGAAARRRIVVIAPSHHRQDHHEKNRHRPVLCHVRLPLGVFFPDLSKSPITQFVKRNKKPFMTATKGGRAIHYIRR